MSGPLHESRLFDNPVVGRELRIRIRPWKLAFWAFVHAFVLVGCLGLALAVHIETGGQIFEFGQIAYIFVVAGEVALLSLLVPLNALGFLDRERKDRSLDQFLVSGTSPYRALFGKVVVSFVYQLVLLTVTIPFLLLCQTLGGVSLGLVITTYLVLSAYILFLLCFSISLTTQIADLAAALVTGPGLLGLILLVHMPRTPGALRALNPLQHVWHAFRETLLSAGVPLAPDSTFYGIEIAPGLLSIAYFTGLAISSSFVALMGPEIPLLSGLHVFGEAQRTRGPRSRVRSFFTRSSEIAFLYENRPGWIRRLDIVLREGVITFFFVLLMVILMGVLWPGPLEIFEPTRFLYPLGLFTLVLLPCLSLTGLRGQRVFTGGVRLGRRLVSALAVSRVAFLAKAAVPVLCMGAAVLISRRTGAEMEFDKFVWIYVIGLAFSMFLFALFLMISARMQSAGKALAIGLFIGLFLAGAPLLWFAGWDMFWLEGDSHAVAEASPFIALIGAIEPDFTFDLERHERLASMEWRTDEFEFAPDPRVFLGIYLPLGIGLLFLSDVAIQRSLRRARKAAPAAVAALLLLAVTAPAHAQEAASLEVAVGFEGRIAWVESATIPVSVRVTNTGASALDGVLRIRSSGGWGPGASFEVPVSLPVAAEKKIQRILPSLMGQKVEVELVVGERRVAEAERTVELLSRWPMGPHLLVLDERGPLPVRREVHAAYARPYVVNHPKLWALPDAPEAYIGVGAILLGRFEPGKLGPPQQRALREWVRRGGVLILTPDRVASWQGSFLEDMTGLPGLVLGSDGSLERMGRRYQIPFAEEATATLADLSAVPGETFVGGESGPLVVRRRAGQGWVFLLAFDPWAAPIPGWSGGSVLFNDIIGSTMNSTDRSDWYTGRGSPGNDFQRFDFRRHMQPGGGFVNAMLIGLLFAILVGPGAYVILRRRGRVWAMWIAVPAISLVFAVGSAALSPVYGRIPSTVMSTTVLHLRPGSARGLVARYLVYQSRARERHRLVLRGQGLGMATGLHRWNSMWRNRLVPSREDRDVVEVDPLRVGRWAHSMVHAWGEFELEGPVRAELRRTGDAYSIRVENRSGLDLRDAFVFLGSRAGDPVNGYLFLGSIPAGETHETVHRLDPSQSLPSHSYIRQLPGLSEETRLLVGSSNWTSSMQVELFARIEAAPAEALLAAETDEFTRPTGNFAFLSVPLEEKCETDGAFDLPILEKYTYPLTREDTEKFWAATEFRLPPMEGRPVLGTLSLRFSTITRSELAEISILDRVDGVWIPLDRFLPEGSTTLEPVRVWGTALAVLEVPDADRYLLRPEGTLLFREKTTMARTFQWGDQYVGPVQSVRVAGDLGSDE